MKHSKFDWLKNTKYAFIQGFVMFPVKVKIISLDFENQIAIVKTSNQVGKVSFSNLYRLEIDCPCR